VVSGENVTDPRLPILVERIHAVDERIRSACRRAGRDRAGVTLVAVTKSVSVEIAVLLPEVGIVDLGESRPQELWNKATALPDTVRWHLIGHLQRNKVERTLSRVHLIHSVDSVRLLEALEREAANRAQLLDVLLEVNASAEASKHGFPPAEVPHLVGKLRELRHVRVQGLMTMAALEPEPERCRVTFAALRALRDGLRTAVGAAQPLTHLSMGMSNDFEIAVEEGATLVRIGSALFEGLA
jgi:pyridoxal phosphate enzyme (YggS family)